MESAASEVFRVFKYYIWFNVCGSRLFWMVNIYGQVITSISDGFFNGGKIGL